jgi:hypothetical protein
LPFSHPFHTPPEKPFPGPRSLFIFALCDIKNIANENKASGFEQISRILEDFKVVELLETSWLRNWIRKRDKTTLKKTRLDMGSVKYRLKKAQH